MLDSKERDFGAYIRKQPTYNQSKPWQAPTPFDLNIHNDRVSFEQHIEGGIVDSIHDRFDAKELYELHHPLEQSNQQLQKEFIDDIEQRRERVGTWFYYPWMKSLIHFPSQADYQLLRTVKNQNMNTREEQALLLSTNPLIAGMSVGSNVLEQLAYSGIGGSYTLADFDTLSMSNLNRIHAGMPQVGEAKVDINAKKISELDPYTKQVHMREGVNRDTLEALTELPSIIFDEVDDFSAKALLREYAHRHGIPLVMATDVGETSIIDIERHDIEEVQPFNGRLDRQTIDLMLSGNMTDSDKKRITTKLIGLGNASIRLLSSVLDETVVGTPQLGITASIGGGLAALVSRDILLGSKVPSGRKVLKSRRQLGLSSQTSLPDSLKTIHEFITRR